MLKGTRTSKIVVSPAFAHSSSGASLLIENTNGSHQDYRFWMASDHTEFRNDFGSRGATMLRPAHLDLYPSAVISAATV